MDSRKMPSVINSVTLNERTYHDITFQPTLINFFYGRNGTGKTTIAENIYKMKSVEPKLSDYDILVYNSGFIASNIQDDKEISGVFSIGDKNIEKLNELESLQQRRDALRSEFKAIKQEMDQKNESLTAARKDAEEKIWNITKSFRDNFKKSLTGAQKSKSAFLTELLKRSTAKEADTAELKVLYDTAYNNETIAYPLLSTTELLDETRINGFTLLETEIISSSDSQFAAFIRAIGASDWLHRGHRDYSGKANGKCPYCGQSLPQDYEEEFAQCFDKQYEKDIAVLRKYASEYSQVTDRLISVFEGNRSSTFPGIDFSRYDGKLQTLKATINLNNKSLEEKLASPSLSIHIDSVSVLIEELNNLVADFNKQININNSIVAAREEKQRECKDLVWQHILFLCQPVIDEFRQTEAEINANINRLNNEKTKVIADGKASSEQIIILSKQISGVDATLESINRMLENSDFQGFHLEKYGGKDSAKYMIVRSDRSPAYGLSEGERNFIAFLYFYHKVLGKERSEDAFKDRVVVIDDPVSSMDSSSLFVVSSLVRELIGICYNNGIAAKKGAPNFIKQMFILTHNAYFHQEISFDKVRCYHCVNFYLIKKYNNVSTINLCVKKDPFSDEPAIEHNYSPVQNSYAALWQELNEVRSSASLIRVIRQILEYYFIQISGYEGAQLRERILKDESIFIIQNSDGSDDKSLLHSVNGLLRYIGTDAVGFNDGFDFIEGFESPDITKKTFKKIFEAMGQEQHYNMMMGIGE